MGKLKVVLFGSVLVIASTAILYWNGKRKLRKQLEAEIKAKMAKQEAEKARDRLVSFTLLTGSGIVAVGLLSYGAIKAWRSISQLVKPTV